MKKIVEKIQKNIDITNLSNYKTPARAEYFYEIKKEEEIGELYEVVQWSKKHNLPILWVSWGTNMLFAFDIYKGLVIKNSLHSWAYNPQTYILNTYGAESIWSISESLEEKYGQNLWHRFIGLPGSIAGAIYWNAGCFGLETENNFVSCNVLDLETGELSIIEKKCMDFSYRSSRLKKEKKYFIISAVFDLSKKIEKYHSDVDNIDFRKNKQPSWNSCGSFFKNPSREQSAGFLIDSVGLKGYKIWGAYFSKKHANFLMHDMSGTYKDMLELIQLAQEKVFQKYGIQLENEVQIITNN